MKKRRQLIIILIVFLVVGFASVSTTLFFHGKTNIGANLEDFDVIFIEALLDGEKSDNVRIDEKKKNIIFTSNKLSLVGEKTRIDYKVKNTSTQYNADVVINCTNEANEDVEVTSLFDNKTLPLESSINMEAQEIKRGFIEAKLLKPTSEDKEIKISCSIEVNATSRETYKYSLLFDSDGGTKIDDKDIELNNVYGNLEVPTKEGYVFLGWFNENDERVDETTIFDTKGNRILHAKWAKEAYDVVLEKYYPNKEENAKLKIEYASSVNQILTIDDNYYITNIECDNGYTVDNFDKDIIKYGSQTLIINNNKNAKCSTCKIFLEQGIFPFDYTGSEQEFTVPYSGEYKVELWGAGTTNTQEGNSYGGYSSGNVELKGKNNIYVYVGGQGKKATTMLGNTGGGYNGGGNAGYYSNGGTYIDYTYGGSGATDIRLIGDIWNNFESLKSRIIVAGGGSGCNYSGGGLSSYGYNSFYPYATQTTGNAFGYGCFKKSNDKDGGGGSGGGYYGGFCNYMGACGAGGSSFISGHNGCNAIAESSTQTNIIHTGEPNHYSGYVFKDTKMIDGAGYNWTNVKGAYTGMPSHDGTSTMTGNSGNGYAKITLLSKE